jgi:SAM-dependent methyltransferase
MERNVSLVDLFERLDRERLAADRQYNDALTELDRAMKSHQERQPMGSPPAFHDASQAEQLNQSWRIADDPHIDDHSIKGRLAGFIWRVVGPALQAQQRFNAAIVEHANRNIAAQGQAQQAAAALVEAARREVEALWHFEWLLLQFLQTITGYVDTKDRSAGGPEMREHMALVQQRLTMVERRLARSDARPTPPPTAQIDAAGPSALSNLAPATYLGFEDRFRGASGEIRERLAPYAPLFAGASDVLDIGCGRGELLDLLREHGVTARGIDSNQAMVDECRSRGLNVEHADAAEFLERLPDASLGGLVAIQVVEHFEPAYLSRVLNLAYTKLRPGAPLVLETINPACWMAFFETYIRDPTHARPLHPDTLRYLVQATGFSSVNLEYRAPVTEGDRLERVSRLSDANPTTAAIAATVNANADKLNARLFSSMDYAIIARR